MNTGLKGVSLGALVLLLTACGAGSSDSGDDSIDFPSQPGGGDFTSEVPGEIVPDIGPGGVAAPFANNGVLLNILPPGQDDNGGLENADLPLPLPIGVGQLGPVINQISEATGLIPALAAEPHFQDQLGLYDALVHSDPGLTDADLTPDYFKEEVLRAPEDGPWEQEITRTQGELSVQIKRDNFGVPHIYGDSREDAMFGAGFVTAQDRLFLLDVLRRAGRGELSRFLGPADLAFDQDIARTAPYREADRSAQIERTREKFDADGEQIRSDLDAFVAGLNNYVNSVRNLQVTDAVFTGLPIEYLALGVPLENFKVEDVHAIATLIQSIFAGGGGGEVDNLRLVNALNNQLGDPEAACRLWRDIRHAVDPDSSVTITERFATQSPRDYNDDICPLTAQFAGDYPASAVFDAGSFTPHDMFRTTPCGRPGQPVCPDPIITGNLPQLPATSDPLRLLDGILDGLLGGLLSENRSLARPPLRIAASVNSQRLDAARKRIAGLAQNFASLARGAHGVPHQISNALLVDGAHTASGNPIAVFGPQTSYFSPQLLLEMDVHGGDINSRGMTFAGLPYVLIGRGVDFAWSATSGNSDLTDVRALHTCTPAAPHPGSDPAPAGVPTGYLRNGQCKPFDFIIEQWPARWNLAVPIDDPADIGQNLKVNRDIIRTEEYGPVIGFASLEGQPIALSLDRSTYRAELDTVIPFYLASRNSVHDAQSFLRAFNTTTGSFNWFYIDRDDIAYIHAGRFPIRNPGAHPDVPVWGDGSADWRGFLPLGRHPRAINPERGYLASWNNRPAPGWWASDANASYSPTHRNEALTVRLEQLVADGNVTRGKLVEAMGDAATVDLRGQELLPNALDVLATGELTDAQAQALQLMRDWIEDGAMRRDRDEDGAYDDESSVALMDAWYNPMIELVLPQITPLENVNGENLMIMQRDNSPGAGGSAYQAGYYGYLERVFDMALDRAQAPYRVLRCADSSALADCQQALSTSLDTAIAALGGIDNIGSWNANEAADRIQHRALGLSSVPAIDWQNRPTFQQVVEFDRRR